MSFEPVIGIETHVELNTKSKMFCGCSSVDSTIAQPNQFVCPICAGFPGTLPTTNSKAIEYGILISLALNCKINRLSIFSRKNYFYPDLPKGYQISQHSHPLASQGSLTIQSNTMTKMIRIRSVHLEEDAGKLIHSNPEATLIDLNRAGIPLVEIVSEPDLSNAEEAVSYAKELRSILSYLQVSTGHMEKGALRFEANVSIRQKNSRKMGVRREIKNLNSFKALQRSIEYETQQQIKFHKSNQTIVQQTLAWNETTGQTVVQRTKENDDDYRYFPEPDLPNILIENKWINELKQTVPELPFDKRKQFQAMGISFDDAHLLASKKEIATYFDAAVKIGANCCPKITPNTLANWITTHLFRLLNEFDTTIDKTHIRPQKLVSLITLVKTDIINVNSARLVLREIHIKPTDPLIVVNQLNLQQTLSDKTLSTIVNDILEQHPEQTQLLLEGKTSVFNWLFGQIMKSTKGKSNPKTIKNLLKSAIENKRIKEK
ncbi:MAG TPA: Asp-tRNA(Asn)/Glu-tRNA(Gln) amidotransferase GatCAB subunit B [Chloroflexi bacterium]|nr:Asp-tRNA(Asn)/Glu-tRNA(Gln) amidotransferase GatCAB subunit B [Chloroflexota bacterium]